MKPFKNGERIQLSPEMALEKAKNWCAYQERSQDETRRKLSSLGLGAQQVEELIAQLISENFINEERFAIALAGGKFRMKKWGRHKIKAELRRHKITETIINKALQTIPYDEYDSTLTGIIEKRLETDAGSEPFKFFYSLQRFLVARGFETELVEEKLRTFKKSTSK